MSGKLPATSMTRLVFSPELSRLHSRPAPQWRSRLMPWHASNRLLQLGPTWQQYLHKPLLDRADLLSRMRIAFLDKLCWSTETTPGYKTSQDRCKLRIHIHLMLPHQDLRRRQRLQNE